MNGIESAGPADRITSSDGADMGISADRMCCVGLGSYTSSGGGYSMCCVYILYDAALTSPYSIV